MFCLENPCTDVYFNLAAEEYLLKKKSGNYFMLWQNTPSVVLGKHQSVEAEIDMAFVQQQGIDVARRFSGGGTVYHDRGNINLTFIERIVGPPNFNFYLQQTIDFLGSIGVTAHGDERLGLYINQLKISGSAQCIHKDRVMYHCTLLFDTDLHALKASLQGKHMEEVWLPGSRLVRAIPSVRSEVTNICQYLSNPLDVNHFMHLIFRYFLDEGGENSIYRFTAVDLAAIEELRQEKYARKEWIFPGH